ncbi:DUF6461 domain-containing protein [Spirillospora sp. NPDC047279]|uniref:DUF6461 domain-containing protein n=1 Tax=Spirillospora sp. NPDC047279 TaxID=3155478 RepID=UPI0033FC5063
MFCASFFHGLAPADVLRRFGPDEEAGRQMPVEGLWEVVEDFVRRTREGSGSGHVGVRQVGEWSVALELLGWYAVLHECYPAFSRGCEMVAVSRHDYAEDSFVYAADGELITGFASRSPGRRWGGEPDRLNRAMGRAGLLHESVDDAMEAWPGRHEHRIARSFALAAEVTGVAFTPSLLDGPFLVGAISPHR